MKNLFIAFEGIDGSGKSTQVRLLKERLEAAGQKVYTTFEPTDSAIGKMIRQTMSYDGIEADNRVIAGLFVADRLNHILNKTDGILKKLEEGYTVITDRYYLSSYAYQGAHMDLNWVIEANSQSAKLLRPDLNIFIDITPEVGMARIQKGRETLEIFETMENQKKVHAKYQEAMELVKDEEQIFVVDGNRDPELIGVDIWEAVNERMRE